MSNFQSYGGLSPAAGSTVLKTAGTVMSGMGIDTSARRHKFILIIYQFDKNNTLN